MRTGGGVYMKVDFQISGMKELKGTLQRQSVLFVKETKKAVREEAEQIMDESLKEVPRDTEALANSAYIDQDAEGNVTFGYGGPNAQINPKTGQSTEEYMLAVHERLDVNHPNGKAKFLEDPINRRTAAIENRLISRLRRFLGGK